MTRMTWGVRRRAPLFLSALLLASSGWAPLRAEPVETPIAQAAPAVPAPARTPKSPCIQAAFDAEVENHLPIGLLLAIGRIESGRADPLSGHVAPWPWTTNSGGEGRFFATKEDAIGFLRQQMARGVQSVDVGCFQVNLYYHPGAFMSPEEAFDPAANARYAARFLTQLRDKGGDWPSAVGLYHSATPSEGGWYRDRVLASWNGGDLVVAPKLRMAFAASPRMSDPNVVILSNAAYGIQVWTPQMLAQTAGGQAVGARPSSPHDFGATPRDLSGIGYRSRPGAPTPILIPMPSAESGARLTQISAHRTTGDHGADRGKDYSKAGNEMHLPSWHRASNLPQVVAPRIAD